MTVGIYAIYFTNIDKIYVGQSQQIEQRFIAHKSLFSRGHYNYKMANAYYKDPNPEYIILEVCSISNLNELEIHYINEFDSITSGLNIQYGGESGRPGFGNGKCKYTREELELAFNLLTDPKLTKAEISKLSGIPIYTITSIISGDRHIWLHEYYPKISEQIKCNKFNRFKNAQENRFKTRVTLLDPEGNEHICHNIAEFARMHRLNTGHLSAVVRQHESQHKGWKLKDKEVNK